MAPRSSPKKTLKNGKKNSNLSTKHQKNDSNTPIILASQDMFSGNSIMNDNDSFTARNDSKRKSKGN